MMWKWETPSWSGDWGPSCDSCSYTPRQHLKEQSCAPGLLPAQKESRTPSIASSWSPLMLMQFLPFFPVLALVPEGPFCVPPAAPQHYLCEPPHWATAGLRSLTMSKINILCSDPFWGSVLHPQISWIAGKGKWESVCLAENYLGGFVWGQDLCSLGLCYYKEDMSQCCVSWGLVSTSQ